MQIMIKLYMWIYKTALIGFKRKITSIFERLVLLCGKSVSIVIESFGLII